MFKTTNFLEKYKTFLGVQMRHLIRCWGALTDFYTQSILKTKLFKTKFWQISLYFLSLTHFFNQLLEPIEVKFQCIIPVITLTVLSSPSLLYSLFLMQYFQVLESVSEDVGFNIEIKWICQQKVSKCTGAVLWLKLVIWHNNFL